MEKLLRRVLFLLIFVLSENGCGVDSSSLSECGDNDSDSDTDADSDSDTDSDTEIDTSDYVYYEDFEGYKAGDNITFVAGYPWVLLEEFPPPERYVLVSDEQASNGTKSLKIVDDNEIDFFLEFQDGRHVVEFDLLLDEGKAGYYNFQYVATWGQNDAIAFEMYFFPGGTGELFLGGKAIPFGILDESAWATCSHIIDVDGGIVEVYVSGVLIYKWPIGMDGGVSGSMDAISFSGRQKDQSIGYYIDVVTIRDLDIDD